MNTPSPVRVAIVGGGASGLMASIAAAQAGAKVTVLERCDRVGRKLLATGNGRCNLTNLRSENSPYYGRDAGFAKQVISHAPPPAVLKVFEALGLHVREEEEGRVYPRSGQASSVLDVLRLNGERMGVETRCGQAVRALSRDESGFALTLSDGHTLAADRVIVATGGKASPQLGSDGSGYALLASMGHKLTPCYPALVQLRCSHPALRSLKGLRVHAAVALLADDEQVCAQRGEVLFTDYGLSGIAALSLAREAGPALAEGRSVHARLTLLEGFDPAALRRMMRDRLKLFAHCPAGQFATGLLARRVGEALCKAADIPLDLSCGHITEAQADALAGLLDDWRFPVTGLQPFDSAQVTAGGIETGGFDPATLESLLIPGLFAAGEVLDVDGDCGGYNLQFAWASGMLAGRAAAGGAGKEKT